MHRVVLACPKVRIVHVVMAITNVLGLWPGDRGCWVPNSPVDSLGQGLTTDYLSRMPRCCTGPPLRRWRWARAALLQHPYLAVPLAIYSLPQPRYRELEKGYTPAHQRQTQAAGTPYPSRTVGGTLQPQLWLPWHRALHLAFTSTFTLANHDAPKSRSQLFASPVPDLSAFCSGPKFSRVSSFRVPSRAGARGAPGIARPLKAPPVAPKRNRYYTCHQTYHPETTKV
ncbi:hypothetical protein BGZ61DRAFT_200869 [Ilyonectria robusta]|uniref:uncharacterized protein n=1 Tax=Ilyonectria robusta TaxID=1079257 RepID=UPI001E8DBF3B|nr:uncharacterized protein BGZ61DRAFT_200869 [Ilyonectria robusta]KAH8722162.1 hypothetical protein BGZ61DRAFT_200869 [Ilyonectria robusta]